MNVLLDAHALLWYLAGSSSLSPTALKAIQDSANTLYVSPATLWEIGIKDSLGKLTPRVLRPAVPCAPGR